MKQSNAKKKRKKQSRTKKKIAQFVFNKTVLKNENQTETCLGTFIAFLCCLVSPTQSTIIRIFMHLFNSHQQINSLVGDDALLRQPNNIY